MKESTKNIITVILLNYRRSHNIPIIIEGLTMQTIKPDIWLWNNAGHSIRDSRISLEISANQNLKCWPRWFLASFALTKYVMMIDDDIIPTSNNMIEIAINALQSHPFPNAIVGSEGVILGNESTYWPTYSGRIARKTIDGYDGCIHFKNVIEDVLVDIVKGRCLIVKTDTLSELPLAPRHRDFCDDITVSSLLAEERGRVHLVSSSLGGVLADIPDNDPSIALSKQDNWRNIRESAREHYFKSYSKIIDT